MPVWLSKMVDLLISGKRRALLALFIAAAAARLAYFALNASDGAIGSDSLEYIEYAKSLVNSFSFQYGQARAGRPPLYPVFLAAIFKSTGFSLTAVILVQILISSAIPLLVYKIASAYTDSGRAFLPALYTCFYYGLFEQPSRILSETLFTFLLVLGAYLFIKGYRENRLYLALAYLAFAFSALTRSLTVILPAVMPLVFLKGDVLKGFKGYLAFLCIFAAALTPWALRNYSIFQAVIPVNIQSGLGFYGTNNANANGQAYIVFLDEIENSNLSEYEKDRLYLKRGLKYVASMSPADILKSLIKKTGALFYPFLPRYDITFALILPFFFYGLFLFVKEPDPVRMIILVPVAVLAVVTVVFYANPRIRAPFAPFMVLIAFHALERFTDKTGAKGRLALSLWAVINVALFIYPEPARLLVKALKYF